MCSEGVDEIAVVRDEQDRTVEIREYGFENLLRGDVEMVRRLVEQEEVRAFERQLRERTNIPVFAIVGYTNAGKSTLMNALTDAEVLVEDKLFATLDTTTRKYTLPNNQELLFIDTVGFIRKLPHLLIHAFKSTLEEAVQADYLLHIIDASHANALEQAETTLKVLQELKAGNRPVITVLNKVDRVDEAGPKAREALAKLKLKYVRAIEISALNGIGLDKLLEEITAVLKERRSRMLLTIPQKEYQLVSSAIRQGHIFEKRYEDNDVVLDVELPQDLVWQFQKYATETMK